MLSALGRSDNGDVVKFGIGGDSNGPAICRNCSSLLIFVVTASWFFNAIRAFRGDSAECAPTLACNEKP